MGIPPQYHPLRIAATNLLDSRPVPRLSWRPLPLQRARGGYFVSTQSTQDDARRRSPSGIPTCPGCQKTMVFKDKKSILFTDGLADVTYRCETCGTETKRTIKDR